MTRFEIETFAADRRRGWHREAAERRLARTATATMRGSAQVSRALPVVGAMAAGR